MDIELRPGTYVIAVSGGVDSITLLDLLYQKHKTLETGACHLIVAHFDHGIREDSYIDRKLVQKAAKNYGLPFVYDEGHLSSHASEATARTRRYAFLYHVKRASGAQAIITAHHQDDLFETAIINLWRGTGRKGLTALSTRSDMIRPLLGVTKSELLAYAKGHNLAWREDETNKDPIYLRNYIRHNVSPRFDTAAKQRFSTIIRDLQDLNEKIDILSVNQLHIQSVGGMIDRQWFNCLPHNVAKEIMATWLRVNGEYNYNSKTLERLVIAAKVARPGSMFPVSKGHALNVKRERLALDTVER